MRKPDEVVALLRRKFELHHPRWLAGQGEFPITISLQPPVERDVMTRPGDVRGWIATWNRSDLASCLERESRTWARAGAHEDIPIAVTIDSPETACKVIGQARRWVRASQRYKQLIARWPALQSVAACHFDVLADYDDEDFARLVALVEWLTVNRASGYLLRQIPVEGLHSKWLETRTRVVAHLVSAVLGIDGQDLYQMCGLRPLALEVKTHILCPALRRSLGGWRTLTLPIEELKSIRALPRLVIVVENRDTGSALPDFEGALCFAGLGKAVNRLGELAWLRDTPLIYWSDIDTHGFECVDMARSALPQTKTILMDVGTVERFRHLAVPEESPLPATRVLRSLTHAELEVYEGLQRHRWGSTIRIEQERIPMAYAEETIQRTIGTSKACPLAQVGNMEAEHLDGGPGHA